MDYHPLITPLKAFLIFVNKYVEELLQGQIENSAYNVLFCFCLKKQNKNKTCINSYTCTNIEMSLWLI